MKKIFILFLMTLPQQLYPRTYKARFPKKYLIGKFDPSQDKHFIKVETKYLLNPKRTIYLRKETYIDFKKMHEAALKDGVHLKVLSGLRTFSHQKRIWDGKWNSVRKAKGHTKSIKSIEVTKEVLQYSAMPGTSRHHWGTDIDFNSINTNYFKQGVGKRIHDWLKKNGRKFGFIQTYKIKTPANKPGRTTGYEEEPWHWSYIPLAKQYLRHYKHKVANEDLTGFKGSSDSHKINILKNYVQSINYK